MEHQHHHPTHQPHDCHTPPTGADSHNQHAGHSVAMFRDKFWWSLIITIPVVLYSPMVQEWLGFSMPAFVGSGWLPLVLGSWLFFYGGTVFIKGAQNELLSRRPGMMTLIALAIVAAYIYSVATVIWLPGAEFFWELSTLITIMLLGHWIEMKSVQSASGALQELSKLLPDTAELVQGGVVPVADLKVGDIMLIRPGAKMPADGEVVDGKSSVNESMITGESHLVDKTLGHDIIAGTINGNGVLQVRVTKLGEQTALAGIMRLVAEAQRSRSRAQVLADKAAFYLTVVAVIVGAITLAGWLILGETSAFALERMVTVLIIACPHALGLAVPLVTSISTTLAAKNGLLIRRRLALESARKIDVVLFDKTGTLTQGQLGVVDVWPVAGQTTLTVLTMAASVERDSEHPLARAIVTKATAEKLENPAVTDFKYYPGLGVEGNVAGTSIAVGGPQLLESKHIPMPEAILSQVKQAELDGKSIIWVVKDTQVIGAMALTDLIREESREAVRELQAMNIKVAMLTGDSLAVATHVARELGIKDFFAQVLPQHKVDKVKQLQADGSRVAMVGDGVNDAPALTQADIGIAIGAGTDVAIESAGVILMKSDPKDIVKIIRLSRASYGKMVQNLIWATGYNLIAIPLATGFLGIVLPAALGAVLMSISTIVVAINAQFLRKLKLG